MRTELGHIEAIFRYPVKSMAGEPLASAELGWHGLEGDRRFALRRLDDAGPFPFLTAGKLHELVRFTPERDDDTGAGAGAGGPPTHVRTPEGDRWPLFAPELAADIGHRHGRPVQVMQMKHGIFDEADVSVITTTTVHEIARLVGHAPDTRRYRPNIVVRALRDGAFQEDAWVGGVLTFGDGDDAAAIHVTQRDVRCAMVNLDPDTARVDPSVMKAIVRANDNTAGVYGAVIRTGRIAVGQVVRLVASLPSRARPEGDVSPPR